MSREPRPAQEYREELEAFERGHSPEQHGQYRRELQRLVEKVHQLETDMRWLRARQALRGESG